MKKGVSRKVPYGHMLGAVWNAVNNLDLAGRTVGVASVRHWINRVMPDFHITYNNVWWALQKVAPEFGLRLTTIGWSVTWRRP